MGRRGLFPRAQHWPPLSGPSFFSAASAHLQSLGVALVAGEDRGWATFLVFGRRRFRGDLANAKRAVASGDLDPSVLPLACLAPEP
ncbi:unnamed protein product [Linum trigynum]|uniref:Uncharacterized protein n=1 Tax=Linum trigynum TaxID=586398 RepID=A0AAV2FWA0_9ROSI